METGSLITRQTLHRMASCITSNVVVSTLAVLVSVAALILSISCGSNIRQKGPNLDHIPSVLSQLTASKRRAEYRKNAKDILEVGYHQVGKTGHSMSALTISSVQQIRKSVSSRDVGRYAQCPASSIIVTLTWSKGPMVVLNAKQTEEISLMPEHKIDNVRPVERVSTLCQSREHGPDLRLGLHEKLHWVP